MGSRGRGLRPGGLLRELLRLMVLVVLGFGAGLLFGVVTEEPALLAGHLGGKSESVELAPVAAGGAVVSPSSEENLEVSRIAPPALSASAGAPGKLASSGVAQGARSAGRARAPSLESQPTRQVVSAPQRAEELGRSATGRGAREPTAEWTIQVGAFADETAARRLADSLRGAYPVAVLRTDGAGKRWRVRVQPIQDEQRARQIADRLKREEQLPTWVTRLEAR